MSKTHSTNFVSSSKPPVNEIVKPVEAKTPRKIRVDLKKSKLKNPTLPTDKLHNRSYKFDIFVEKLGIFA